MAHFLNVATPRATTPAVGKVYGLQTPRRVLGDISNSRSISSFATEATIKKAIEDVPDIEYSSASKSVSQEFDHSRFLEFVSEQYVYDYAPDSPSIDPFIHIPDYSFDTRSFLNVSMSLPCLDDF
ncbi:hypothetical protein RCL1_000621 [Eukaryota sp. TZLM3-RCL]